jgi:beta-xylosidase
VHLQPMRWVNNWPVIGIDKDGDGKGEPVLTYKKPSGKSPYGIITPPESDEFNAPSLGLQWQWQANPAATWSFSDALKGGLRLYSVQEPEDAKNLWDLPNLLLQKFPAETFTVTTKLSFHPSSKPLQERTGLVVLGLDYAALEIQAREDGQYLQYSICENAEKKTTPEYEELIKLTSAAIFLRVMVSEGGNCRFSYSTDGNSFTQLKKDFKAKPGKWVGAKVGLFCSRSGTTNDAGYALIDWFRIHKNNDLK